MDDSILTTDLVRCRAVVIGTLPHFAGRLFSVLKDGPNGIVLECDGWVFKFPRGASAEARLRREVSLLGHLRPRVTMALPQMALHGGTFPFSQHRKLPGLALGADEYRQLDEPQRNALAARLAQLYAELHALPLPRMRELGAVSADPWASPEDIVARAVSRLPRRLHAFARRTIKDYVDLPFPGDEVVFGYFDGHGENMAFDFTTGMLNGVFDFADAGFGPRHRDLCHTDFISPDLTTRIIAGYERLTGRHIHRQRVTLYGSALRLVKLGSETADEQAARADLLEWQRNLSAWR